ncbi:AAA family ATPase [Thalassococcus sp. S3]|uniref:AAA family ATPase n=1 Tax=Thalassococcus sp. S3 TaxID=2017482 RepID=UPI0010244806|nr:AAA family ATPase [Thalassococcus sp. S3]QBF32312.1 conjugal transfer protein TraA [Thalassococcus sp. S3]
MILEGNARGYGAELARHLMNLRDNDHVSLHLLDGFVAEDLAGALEEAEAISQATQCRKYLFSLSLNPPPEASLSEAQFEAVIAQAERDLGLVGQPKAIVFHEKTGRRHAHVVWSRIDASRMKAINLPHFKRKLMAISRAQYREHSWDMPPGFTDAAKRDPNRFTNAEAGQAKRAKRDPAQLKAMFRACWDGSDTQSAFAAALADQGYVLARGDRRGFVAVDQAGKVWSLSRWCWVKSRALKAKITEPEHLPDVEAARHLAKGLTPSPALNHARQDEAYRAKLADLITAQRDARAQLLETQRRREAERLRQAPGGFRIAFLKVTGRYRAFVAQRAKETAQAQSRAAQERQALIDRHLRERRAFEREHARAYAKANRDSDQRFEPQQDAETLSAARIARQPDLVLAELSKTKASFTRIDVLRELSRWINDPAALSKAANVALASPEAVQLSSDQRARYTTRDYQAAETMLHGAAERLASSSAIKVAPQHIADALTAQNRQMKRSFGGKLSEEQTRAIKAVLGKERLAQVVGLAGAGKSTLLATAADAWRRHGVTVHGAALAGKAADGLHASSGIPSRTLAALELSWENGHAPIKPGDVLVIDEAGMIGTRQMARVTVKMEEIGAKLVLVGDPDQLQPIEAGTPFRDLVARHGAAQLSEVRRQKADWQRGATQALAKGETSQAVETYRCNGAVSAHQTQDAAIEALAERYAMDALADPSRRPRLALAHKRLDVHKLNQSIRAAIRPEEQTGDDVMLQTETGKRAFGSEDRIVFTRNDTELGVKNGMLGSVQQASDGKMTVTLDGDDQQRVTFDPRTYRHFDHGYAVTIHKSQGVTVDQAYVLGSRSMDKHLAYVALTRHREDVQLYTSAEDRPTWTQHRTVTPARTRARDGPSMG